MGVGKIFYMEGVVDFYFTNSKLMNQIFYQNVGKKISNFKMPWISQAACPRFDAHDYSRFGNSNTRRNM